MAAPTPSEPDTDSASELPPSYEDAAIQHGSLPSQQAPRKARGPVPLDLPVLNELRGKRVILASASPRRKQLLAQIGLTNLEITPSTKPENLSKTALSPFEYVLKTAAQKCMDVYETALKSSVASIPDPALVIAADTVIVTSSGLIVEKPRSEADHIAMLQALRGQKSHKVCTAVVVVAPREDARHPGYNTATAVVETKVFFDANVSNELILAYVRTRESVGMAGGYGIQGMGTLLVERIEGSWDNVVGLPIGATLRCIERCLANQGSEDSASSEEE